MNYSKKNTNKGFGAQAQEALKPDNQHDIIDEIFAAAGSLSSYIQEHSDWECSGGGMFLGQSGANGPVRDVDFYNPSTDADAYLQVGIRPLRLSFDEDCPQEVRQVANQWLEGQL